MAYCLLPGKDRHTYNRVLLFLKDSAMMMGISFDLRVVVSDFELAVVQDSTMSFPNAWLALQQEVPVIPRVDDLAALELLQPVQAKNQ